MTGLEAAAPDRRPLNRLRAATARAMQASAAVPRFTLERRVRADALLAVREERRAARAGRGAPAAQVLATLVDALEEPAWLTSS